MRTPLVATAIILCAFSWAHAEDQPPLVAEIVSVEKIWDAAPHNAFTDLIRHNDQWWCVFREGQAHVSDDGKIRVLVSSDGQAWKSAALVSHPKGDLRDAKLSVTPGGELMMSTVVATTKDPETKHQSLTYFSKDGANWDGPHPVGDRNFWLWRTSWHKDVAYNIGYATHGERLVRLYTSRDGKKFETLAENLGVKNEYPNESALAWDDAGQAYCLLRCERPHIAQLGTSQPPYKEWTWRELDKPVGGPQLTRHASGHFLAAGRIYQPAVHTSLCWLDLENNRLVELIKLPSGGDTSYPGLVWHDGLLWMSYYSSHEGKTSVYLAKLKVERRAG